MTDQERITALEAEVAMQGKIIGTLLEAIHERGAFDSTVIYRLEQMWSSVRPADESLVASGVKVSLLRVEAAEAVVREAGIKAKEKEAIK